MALNYDIQNHQYTVRQGHRSYQHHYSKALGWKLNALNFTKFHHKTEPVISVTIATSSATFITTQHSYTKPWFIHEFRFGNLSHCLPLPVIVSRILTNSAQRTLQYGFAQRQYSKDAFCTIITALYMFSD